jgi:NAD(P)-dependent dehydrogenase (short-subunit alcohol dehydrogenase family)
MSERDPRTGPSPAKEVPQQEFPGVESELEPKADHGEESYRGCGKLDGLAAVITGGDSGIGRATAIAFAREGCDVAIGYYSETERDDAGDTAEWVRRAGKRALAYGFDVREPEECTAFVDAALKEFGRLDIVVNNAAYQCETDSISEITHEQLERTFRTNIFGCFYMVQAALPHLKAGAVILNTGSVVALAGKPTLIDYSATKGAIHTFTKSLAMSLADKGIRVNCVAPGPVWTPLIPATMGEESTRTLGDSSFWERPAQPVEIAPSFVFLASNDGIYYTGEVFGPTGRESTR